MALLATVVSSTSMSASWHCAPLWMRARLWRLIGSLPKTGFAQASSILCQLGRVRAGIVPPLDERYEPNAPTSRHGRRLAPHLHVRSARAIACASRSLLGLIHWLRPLDRPKRRRLWAQNLRPCLYAPWTRGAA
jgi:hypothetical protein